MPSPDPTVRTMLASAAAHALWASVDDPAARTAAMRQASDDRFIPLAREKYGDLPDDELARRAEHLRKAHYKLMAARSVLARKAKAEARKATRKAHRAETGLAELEQQGGADAGTACA